jgi:hypothetical protein
MPPDASTLAIHPSGPDTPDKKRPPRGGHAAFPVADRAAAEWSGQWLAASRGGTARAARLSNANGPLSCAAMGGEVNLVAEASR